MDMKRIKRIRGRNEEMRRESEEMIEVTKEQEKHLEGCKMQLKGW
jgi:hypothetical protein